MLLATSAIDETESSHLSNNTQDNPESVVIDIESKESRTNEDTAPPVESSDHKTCSDSSLEDDYIGFVTAQEDVDLLYIHIQTVLSEQLISHNRDAIAKAFHFA